METGTGAVRVANNSRLLTSSEVELMETRADPIMIIENFFGF